MLHRLKVQLVVALVLLFSGQLLWYTESLGIRLIVLTFDLDEVEQQDISLYFNKT